MQPDATEQAPALTRSYPRTDLGNAERLVADHSRDLRFAPGLGWYAWDGRRWKRDIDGELMRRAKRTVRAMYADAGNLEDAEERKKTVAWGLQSESEARLRAACKLAETEREVIAAADELDAKPMLFNALNGTIDLETGELREHRREDLLTRISPVVYDPDARSEIWDSFLRWITDGDAELAEFLRRAAGYTLTGHTVEEVLFFGHGPSATGKSSFMEALRAVAGEYGAVADFETFLKRRGDAGIRNDIARLAGARLVVSIEVDDGKTLAEGLIKLLTGGDTVAARFLYNELFEYRPSFKLWLVANARPKVSADDDALWRRVLQVPFGHVVPEGERDERIKIALRTDPAVHTAILAWAVEGCLAWRYDGLNVPQTVRDYTAAYRAENDPLRDWLADSATLEPDAWTATAELRKSYDAWCETNAEKPLGTNQFAAALTARGCNRHKSSHVRGWKGISLDPEGTPGHPGTPDSENLPYTPTRKRFPESAVPAVPVSPEVPA